MLPHAARAILDPSRRKALERDRGVAKCSKGLPRVNRPSTLLTTNNKHGNRVNENLRQLTLLCQSKVSTCAVWRWKQSETKACEQRTALLKETSRSLPSGRSKDVTGCARRSNGLYYSRPMQRTLLELGLMAMQTFGHVPPRMCEDCILIPSKVRPAACIFWPTKPRLIYDLRVPSQGTS